MGKEILTYKSEHVRRRQDFNSTGLGVLDTVAID